MFAFHYGMKELFPFTNHNDMKSTNNAKLPKISNTWETHLYLVQSRINIGIKRRPFSYIIWYLIYHMVSLNKQITLIRKWSLILNSLRSNEFKRKSYFKSIHLINIIIHNYIQYKIIIWMIQSETRISFILWLKSLEIGKLQNSPINQKYGLIKEDYLQSM